MCNNRNSSPITLGKRRFKVDACIRDLIQSLNSRGIMTVASCCGHNIYPVTILYRNSDGITKNNIYDFCSGWGIPRTRNFYKSDEWGYYFIPEVMEYNRQHIK